MKITNRSHIADDVVAQVAAFVAPPGCRGVAVTVTNARAHESRGRAFPHSKRVIVRVAPVVHRMPERGAYLGVRPATSLEMLVHILAHELRHIWQYNNPTRKRVWGSRGRYSERDADAYGIHMLRRWRREHPLGGRR